MVIAQNEKKIYILRYAKLALVSPSEINLILQNIKNINATMYDNKRLKTIPQKKTSHKGSDRENKTSWCRQYDQWQYGHLSPWANNHNNFLTNKIFPKSKLQITLQLFPESEASSLGKSVSCRHRQLLL